jgi:hypothetical protein
VLEGEVRHVLVCSAFAELIAGVLEHAVDDGLVLGKLGGSGDEGGVGGGVLGAEFFHRLDIAGIGNDHRVVAQLFEQILRHSSSLGCGPGLRAGTQSVGTSVQLLRCRNVELVANSHESV